MRKMFLFAATMIIAGMLTACNFLGYDLIDTNYHFDYAVICLPNGEVVEGEIKTWSDAEDGEQLTITMKDGTRYLTSSYNCTLIER